MTRRAWGYGLATTVSGGGAAGTVLDTWYPGPALGEMPGIAAPQHELTSMTGVREDVADRGVRIDVTLCEIDLDAPPAGTSDAYLRLHLLSHRLLPPHGLNLDGIFSVLPNVV